MRFPKFTGFHLHKPHFRWGKYQPLYSLLLGFLGGLLALGAVSASGYVRGWITSLTTSPYQEIQLLTDTGFDKDNQDGVLGDPEAPVEIVEYVDYECPFCKRHFEQVHPLLISEYVSKGLARLVMRDFPLTFHDPAATESAIASRCAEEQGGDRAYFGYHDEIFTRTAANGQGLPAGGYEAAAQKLGLNVDQLKSCLSTEKFKDEVQEDLADGQAAGVGGTPSFFINGTILVGAQPFEAFQAAIEEALK